MRTDKHPLVERLKKENATLQQNTNRLRKENSALRGERQDLQIMLRLLRLRAKERTGMTDAELDSFLRDYRVPKG